MSQITHLKRHLAKYNKELKKLRAHANPTLMADRIEQAKWWRHVYWTRLRLARRRNNTSSNP